MKFINKLANWYFTRRALPYWMVLLIDCLICYLSGLFVFWLYYRGAVTLGNLGILSKTILLYMVFNLIGFRLFRTYSGIIRYSSFVDLMHVAMAQGVSLIIAEVMHYVVYGWQLQFVRLEGRQIVAMYVVATIGMMIFRVLVKTVYDVVFASDTGQRTLIYGVRDGGAALAKAIRNEKPARFLLKGFISHDKKYDKHRLMGVSVYPADERLGGDHRSTAYQGRARLSAAGGALPQRHKVAGSAHRAWRTYLYGGACPALREGQQSRFH